MRKLFLLLFFLFSTVLGIYAQKSCSCDDFNKEFKQEYDKNFRASNFEVAKQLSKKLETSGDNCCKAVAQILYANVYLREMNLDSALFRVKESEKLLGGQYDSLVSPEQYRLRGQICENKELQDSTIFYYIAGLKDAEARGNLGYVVKFCNDIAYTFGGINQPEKGIIYMKKALETALTIKDNSLCAMAYSNLATSYGMLSENTGNRTYLDSMRVLAPLSLKYAKMANDRMYMIKSYNILSGLSVEDSQFVAAIAYCDTVLIQLPPKGLEQLKVSALYRMGQSYYALGNMEASVNALLEGLELAKFINNVAIIKLFYQQLYYTYKDYKKPELALTYFESYKSLSDSILNIEKSTAINDLEQKYNKEKNEQTIKELNTEKQISDLKIRFLITGILVAVLIAILIFLYYYQKNLKHQRTILETEQRLNRARMNPHFFFNALAALQSFALKENDGKQLAINLSKFSHIMRETLESTYKDYVTIEQEIDFLREYLALQKMRFPDKFSYQVELETDFEIEHLMIPSMIIQPFIENSIEHGFSEMNTLGEIKILFNETAEDIVITIIDNGKGLSDGPKEEDGHISRASQIIKDRIYLLNIKLKTKASFSIKNNESDAGVIVHIYLPKINKNASTNN